MDNAKPYAIVRLMDEKDQRVCISENLVREQSFFRVYKNGHSLNLELYDTQVKGTEMFPTDCIGQSSIRIKNGTGYEIQPISYNPCLQNPVIITREKRQRQISEHIQDSC